MQLFNHITSADVEAPGTLVKDTPLTRPEDSGRERLITVLIFLVSFAYLCLFRRYNSIEPDEGIILQASQRVLEGQVPYRDFFSFYTPGSCYLLAALFKLFGSSIMVARTVLAATGAVLSVITYLIARRVCTRGWSLVTTGLITLTSVAFRFLVLHNWDSTLWACLAVYCALRWQESESSRWSLATGTFCALTVLFEQSKGVGLVLGLLAGLLLVRAVRGRRAKFSGWSQWLAAAVGFGWPFILTFAWFVSRHALTPMLADWLWPLEHYSRANSVPYGYQNWTERSRAAMFGNPSRAQNIIAALVVSPCLLVPVLPIVALGILANLSLGVWRHKARDARTEYYLLVTGSLAGLLLSVVIVRADIIHIMYLAPLIYLVLAWILDGSDVRSEVFRAVQPALRVFTLAVFGLLAAALLVRSVGAKWGVETRHGSVRLPARDTVLEYTLAHVPPGSTILVYPYLPLYYYLTGTYSPAPYDYLQPGMHDAAQGEELIRSLARDRTRVVLYEISFNEKIANAWPNTPPQYIAEDPVGDYIVRNYKPCSILKSAEGWRFLALVRGDLACP